MKLTPSDKVKISFEITDKGILAAVKKFEKEISESVQALKVDYGLPAGCTPKEIELSGQKIKLFVEK